MRQIKTHGYEVGGSPHSFKASGPYTEKVSREPVFWTPEDGNPLIPKHARQQAIRVQGYRGDEFDWSKGAAFLIQGTFTRKASRGLVSEETGVIFV